MTTNFMIGPIKEGLRKDVKPYATPEDSFESLVNAYQWRGRIVRRQGYTLLGRLQRSISYLNYASLNLLAGLESTATLVPGSVVIVGAGAITWTDDGQGNLVPSNVQANAKINYITGLVTQNGLGNPVLNFISVTFNYYPGIPVMGLRTRELFVNTTQSLIAFDTIYAYLFNTTLQQFQQTPSVMPTIWSGTNYDFFFTTNYAGGFWATNYKQGLHGAIISGVVAGAGFTTITTSAPNGYTSGQEVVFININPLTSSDLNGNGYVITVTGPTTFTIPFQTLTGYTSGGTALNSFVSVTGQDGIRYYGDLTNGPGWANYNPPVDPNNALMGCLLIFPYRGYLVFLNTFEGNELADYNYGNRARWTQIGTPYYSQPVPTNPNPQGVDVKAVRDDLFGRGGANDAPTSEVIIGAGFVRDVLIVNFERSSWRLRFVNNAQNPFVWERINTELGSDCTFSSIPFDKGLMSISNRGIVICDGNDVIRFDEKIPDDIFTIRQANNGLERVYGIRTFRTKLNMWTFPSGTVPNGTFPDQVLVFNYDTKNWSTFDDCFTCFGYYYPSELGKRWSDLKAAWPTYDTENALTGVTQEGYETIIAGNQQGFVLELEQGNSQNEPSLFITAISGSIVTSPNNNLPDGSWITLSGILGTTGADGVSLNNRNFKISNPSEDLNQFIITEFESIDGGAASGTSYAYDIDYTPILPGSIQINVGAIQFVDSKLDGVLVASSTASTGTINYQTGAIAITFNPGIAPTELYIRYVSINPEQDLIPVDTTGAYIGGGLISKLSNFEITSKIFNFFNDDKRARLSKIDFYTDKTANGQFQCDILGDSSNVIINTPLGDNFQSNIVRTSPTEYQIGLGDQTVYRLFADATAQTLQVELSLNDRQMAVNAINDENIELVAMIFSMRRGGRLT